MPEVEEIFVKAPLYEVAYEVRFPSLFYITQKVGEFQLEIMDEFPKASQLIETQFALEGGIFKTSGENPEIGKPVSMWQFEKESGKTRISVRSDRLIINSNEYKSYRQTSDMMFRDIINKTISKFIEKIPVKKFTRIGLRYIDRCPLEEKTNSYFKNYYHPVFNIDKYNLEDLLENHIAIVTKRGRYNIVFQSGIQKFDGLYKYVLDFDGYVSNIDSQDFLSVTDELHDITREEFLSSITEKFKDYMRAV